jgi:PKD repeat protein
VRPAPGRAGSSPHWTRLSLVLLIGVASVLGSFPLAAGVGPGHEIGVATPRAMPFSMGAALVRSSGILPADASPRLAAPDWINLTLPGTTTPPPAGFGSSLAYDPVEQAYVYFGGGSSSSVVGNQTWVFSQGHWLNETNPHDAPPARTQAAMDFDANAGAVLLFGGQGATQFFDDTWSWSAGIWTNLSALSAATPPARSEAMLAFDPASDTNATVLFGGYADGIGVVNDTWTWQPGSGWTQLAPTVSPAARELGAMGYDSALEGLVLFSGNVYCTLPGCSGADTWEWYSGTWWNVGLSPSPPGRFGAFLTGDPAIGGMLLFGGYNSTNSSYLSDTWSFTSAGWTALAPAAHPSARFLPSGAPESPGGAPLLFSGTNDYGVSLGFTDTWTYEVAPTVTVTSAASEVAAPAAVSVRISGGTAPYSVSVQFGDGANGSAETDNGTASLLHTYPDAGTYPLTAHITDALGARASSNSSITVAAGPKAQISVSPAGADVGHPIKFTEVTLARGVVPDQYFWNWLDGTRSMGASVNHTYTVPGTYRVSLNITDADGGWSLSYLDVQVAAAPSVQVTWNPSAAISGSPEILSANLSGGTAPFSYSWSLGDGSWSTDPAPAHTYANSGTYTVQVWVNDSGGGATHGSATVTVATGPGTPGSTGSGSSSTAPIPLYFWAGLGVLAVVAVAGSALLLRKRKAS